MILRSFGKTFKKEKRNEHFKVEIEICTGLPTAEEHIVGDMPLAVGYYVFIASSLFRSHIHSITSCFFPGDSTAYGSAQSFTTARE